MRIGRDAVIFTKDEYTMSVGFLSQTFLQAMKAEEVLIPMVSWSNSDDNNNNSNKNNNGIHASFATNSKYQESLHYILKYSPFTTLDMLQKEFDKFERGKILSFPFSSLSPNLLALTVYYMLGTRAIIYNIAGWGEDDKLEFDFESDPSDIRLWTNTGIDGDNNNTGTKEKKKKENCLWDAQKPMEYSLRAYCEILYLQPTAQM